MSNQQPPYTRSVVELLPDGTYKVDQAWHGWFLQLAATLARGRDASITLAKITPGGTNGTLVFRAGLLIDVTAPT